MTVGLVVTVVGSLAVTLFLGVPLVGLVVTASLLVTLLVTVGILVTLAVVLF